MKTKQIEFIRSKIAGVEKSITSRKQAVKVWRSKAYDPWRVAGCSKSKEERYVIAELEEKLISKLRKDLKLFQDVLETLLEENT